MINYFLNQRRNLIISRFTNEFISDALETILNKNKFKFNDKNVHMHV